MTGAEELAAIRDRIALWNDELDTIERHSRGRADALRVTREVERIRALGRDVAARLEAADEPDAAEGLRALMADACDAVESALQRLRHEPSHRDD